MLIPILFSLLVNTISLLGVTPIYAQALGPAEQFRQSYLDPALSSRGDYVRVSVQEARPGELAKIVVQSGPPGLSVGEYEFILNPNAIGETPPILNLHRRTEASNYPVQIKATTEFPLKPSFNVARALRALFIADPFLHPLQTLPEHSTQLAPPQRLLVDELNTIAADARSSKQAARALIIAPPGFGKNLVVTDFLRGEIARSAQPYQIVFVVQSQEILDDALETYPRELGISASLTRRNFAREARDGPPPLFVAASRTNLASRLSSVLARRQTKDTRIFFVFDEIQHGGKIGGEFQHIFKQLDQSLKAGDALIGQSATPWHLDSDLIASPFQNHLVTAFVNPDAKKRLVDERRLIYLSRMMLFTAMAERYLSPIHSYRQIRYLGDPGQPDVLTRDYLRDEVESVENLGDAERDIHLRRHWRAHEPLLREMLREARRVAHTDVGSGRILSPNRGVIFVPSIQHANNYAQWLNELADGEPMEFRAYHSEMSDDLRRETMKWIRDSARGPGPVRHRYVIAVRALGEGANVPNLNHLILARPYSQHDEVGMRDLLQHLGRGARRAYGKPHFSVSDFTGDMRRLLFADMDQQLLEGVFTGDGEKDFAPFEPPARPKERNVILDRDTYARGEFEPNLIAIPSRLGVAITPVEKVKTSTSGPMTWEQFLNSATSLRWFQVEAARSGLIWTKDCGHSVFDLLRMQKADLNRCFPRGAKIWLRRQLLDYNLVEPSERRPFDIVRSLGEYTSKAVQQNFSTHVPWTERELRGSAAPRDFDLKRALQQLPRPAEDMGSRTTWDDPLTWREVYSSPAFLFYFVYRAKVDSSVLLSLVTGLHKQNLLTILPVLKKPAYWKKQFININEDIAQVITALDTQGLLEIPDLSAKSPYTRRQLLDLPYLYVKGLTHPEVRAGEWGELLYFDREKTTISGQLMSMAPSEYGQTAIRNVEYVLGAYLPVPFYERHRMTIEDLSEAADCRRALSHLAKPVDRSGHKSAKGR